MWLFYEDGADAVTKNSPENVNKLLQGMGVEGQAEIEQERSVVGTAGILQTQEPK